MLGIRTARSAPVVGLCVHVSTEEQGSLCIELVLQSHGILFWEQHDHQPIGSCIKNVLTLLSL